MFNKKGFTLVETLFTFSIYTTCLVLFISDYRFITQRTIDLQERYSEYIIEQNEKEKNLCIENSLSQTINQVSP